MIDVAHDVFRISLSRRQKGANERHAHERARLVQEREGVAKDAAKFEKKRSNPGFLAKAAPEIVEKDRAKLADLTDKLARLDAQIAELG